ncbi:methyltransferase domain-containing protein [Candidatus Berkiella aquae]|uniref:Class I SAM-dependent methyltransferase n=1 Tax=Candidatus Berkiella aquae TaxID=295108 RepID=A0A0Q9YIM2_9GAMM|nr:class I SAM-dependent methyltransferase [Candidatus Berkiella aquae]MCS5712174.1 class I SAM-dependent methyltransferase [Candidatus Berkiella aquae]
MHTYLHLCTQYYDWDKPKVFEDELAFYMQYILAAKGPILEPMCGTGRFLLPVLEAGFDIHGFDASVYMLEKLQQKCQQRNLQPLVWRQFLHDFKTTTAYDLMLIPGGSFGLIIDPVQVKLSLQQMYEHLLPGGKLVFEIETLKAVPERLGVWEGDAKFNQDDNDSMIILSTCALRPQGQVGSIICRYELVQKGNLVKTEIEHFQLRFYTIEEMNECLKSVGFNQIHHYKKYDKSQAASNQDKFIIYECVK